MSTTPDALEALPCPFCGSHEIVVREGSTFRWRYASCDGCGAQSGEVRCQTMGEGTVEQWRADADAEAIAAWNHRAALATAEAESPAASPPETREAHTHEHQDD